MSLPITEVVRLDWGIQLTTLEPVAGGFDAEAATYQGGAEDGTAYFVKHRRTADENRGALVARALRDVGLESVIAPLRTQAGEIASEFSDGTILLYPFVEGANGFDRPLNLAQWREFGEAVSRVHASSLSVPLPEETFRLPRSERFDAIAAQASDSLGDALARYAPKIERVRRRERELGTVCRSRNWPAILCHADLHVGNVLTVPNRLYLVDWDGARRSPRERDLMFILDGGILGGHGQEEETAFFEGYGSYDADPLALTYYRYAWALDDLLAYTEQDDAKWFERQFDPRGIVASAFRSDERWARESWRS